MQDQQPEWPAESRQFHSHLLRQEHAAVKPEDTRERKLCLSWIVKACSEYGFCQATSGLAVKYFDVVMHASRRSPGSSLKELKFKELIMQIGSAAVDTKKFQESQVCELLCILCISLAAKKLEPKAKAPFLGDFDENFTFNELKKMEVVVLNKLNWKLSYSTPHDYIHFWVGRAEWGVDRKKTIVLCHEALATCTVEEEFATPRSASIFGAGAMLWAYYAQGLPTAKLENEFASIGVDKEELHIAVEQIGSYLRVSYPHAFIPRRADSPSNAIDVHKGFFSDDMDAAQGVKRPKPEGFKPYHKLAEMTQTTVVLPAVLRSPVLKAQKKHNGDVPSSILQAMSNSTAAC